MTDKIKSGFKEILLKYIAPIIIVPGLIFISSTMYLQQKQNDNNKQIAEALSQIRAHDDSIASVSNIAAVNKAILDDIKESVSCIANSMTRQTEVIASMNTKVAILADRSERVTGVPISNADDRTIFNCVGVDEEVNKQKHDNDNEIPWSN